MTAKEKAENLIVKYMSFEVNAVYEDLDGNTAVLSETMTYHSAKQCALIHVNELLDMLWMFSDSINGQSTYNEYQQVKEELEKL